VDDLQEEKLLRVLKAISVTFSVMFLFTVSVAMAGADLKTGDIDTSEYEESLKALAPFITPAPEMLKRVKKGLTPDFYEKVEKGKARLLNEVFDGTGDVLKFNGGKGSTSGKGQKKTAGVGTNVLRAGEKIYILVSSSVPLDTLRNYARDMDKLGEPGMYMVLRGFIGGGEKIRPTLKFIRKVVLKDKDCSGLNCKAYAVRMDIDPRIFRKYGVDVVPAIVYESEKGDGYLLYGDMSLEGALLKINKQAKSVALDCLALRLRLGPYRSCRGRIKGEKGEEIDGNDE